MQTLIFRTKRDHKSPVHSIITQFIKEGAFREAMNYFDDQYPISFNDETSTFHWYQNGDIICSVSDLCENPEQTAYVDSFNCLTYYTKDRANLDLAELMAMVADRGQLAAEYWELNGYDQEAFETAYIAKELPILHEMGSEAYLQYKIEA